MSSGSYTGTKRGSNTKGGDVLALSIRTNIKVFVQHRFPLCYITSVVAMRAARTLLERLKSKSYDYNLQFKHVSRHSGT